MKSLERYLRANINLNKSDAYENYKIMVDRQSEFNSLTDD